MTDRLKHYAELIGLLLAGVLLWWTMYKPAPKVGEVHQVETAPQIAGMPTETLTSPVKVLPQKAKEKLGLSAGQQDDPNLYVLGSSKLPADTHPQIVTTLLNTQTGDVTTESVNGPLPWLVAEKSQEVRVDYVIKSNWHGPSISYRMDLVRVKAVDFGCGVAWDFDHEGRVSCGGGWKF